MQEYGLLADDDVVHRDEHQFDHEADETHDGKTHGASDGDFLEPCNDKFLSRSTENIFCQNTISLYPKPTSFGFKIETRFWTNHQCCKQQFKIIKSPNDCKRDLEMFFGNSLASGLVHFCTRRFEETVKSLIPST
jgi:hypothetical protein